MKRLATVLAVATLGVVPTSANAQVIEIGHLPKCTQGIPAAVAVGRAPVSVEMRVVLDGVSQARAQQVVATANRAYAAEGITLNASYQSASFGTADSLGLIAQTKALFGGSRPAGTDLVYTLTSRDITAANQSGVAGQADCIGGVAFPDRAFAVGEEVGFESFSLLGVSFFEDLTAKTVAHEVGHLLGAHHHYANCAEAVTPALLAAKGEPCTLMFNDLSFQRLQFSGVNSAIVRGHAQRYAR